MEKREKRRKGRAWEGRGERKGEDGGMGGREIINKKYRNPSSSNQVLLTQERSLVRLLQLPAPSWL